MKLAFAPMPDLFGIDLLADLKQLGWMLDPAHRGFLPRNPTDLGRPSVGIYELHEDVLSVEPEDLHRSHGSRPEAVDQGLHARIRGQLGHGGEPIRRRPNWLHLSHADTADPLDRVQSSGEVAASSRATRRTSGWTGWAQKPPGSERFEWTMPGERRVSVIVRPAKVRHIIGVERFRPGGPHELVQFPCGPGRQ
ncbi:hypothetical protein ACFWZT_14495 [Streptomyces alboflavus]|uniref:hypothetical protein n=1 Tax=Streptomyces alboflavus TaxID=67267 RepID=UPI0036C05786